MTTERIGNAAVTRLMEFLETGRAPEGLFTPGVFCDFTMPLWRIQAEGLDNVVALRRQGHPGPSFIPRFRCDATDSGFVLEIEERWTSAGQDWYCRELIRADVEGDSISSISVYCTCDWDGARQAQHATAVRLLRP
jgi:hypothetical protein